MQQATFTLDTISLDEFHSLLVDLWTHGIFVRKEETHSITIAGNTGLLAVGRAIIQSYTGGSDGDGKREDLDTRASYQGTQESDSGD